MSQGYPIKHVTDPYVVGGAIIGLKCREGIVIAADTLLSYGGLLSTKSIYLEYQDVSRFEKIDDHSVIVASGEYADFQEVSRRLRSLVD